MKKFILFIVLCCAAIGSRASEIVGQAVSVSGKVLIRSEGSQTMQMNFLKPGDKINQGAIINTVSNGAVKLLMTDKTVLDLGPSSLFKVNEYQLKSGSDRKVDVALDYGQVRASVNQPVSSDKGKFTIRTKAATMGVRGTEFVIQAGFPPKAGEPPSVQQTQLTVIKGRVELSDPTVNIPPVAVTAGMLASKGITTPAQLTQLDANQLQSIRQEAVQKDMTFIQTVSVDSSSTQTSDKPKDTQNKSTQSSEPVNDRGGKQTLKNMSASVETQIKQIAPPVAAEMRLPGMLPTTMNFDRQIDFLNGRPVSLQVRFCPNGC